MGLGFDGPGGATAAIGGAVVRTGIMVEAEKGEEEGWLKNEARGIGQKDSDRLGAWIGGAADRAWDITGNVDGDSRSAGDKDGGGGRRWSGLSWSKAAKQTTTPIFIPRQVY